MRRLDPGCLYVDARPLSPAPFVEDAEDDESWHTRHRIVRLYESWAKPEKAAEWRKRLGLGSELPADPFQR